MDKVKPITLYFEDGREYTLEFSRETVTNAEREGFNVNAIDDMPMTMIPEFFYRAFKMHHPEITKEATDKILFEDLGGFNRVDGLSKRLQELYYVPFETLFGEKKENEPKNPKLRVTL